MLMYGVEQDSSPADAAVVDADYFIPLPYYGPIADLTGKPSRVSDPEPEPVRNSAVR